MRASRIALSGLAVVLLLAITANATAPSVTVVNSLTTVRPGDSPSGPVAASVSAARNEFESFQVVISAGSEPLTGVRVSLASPLTGPGGTIPAADVTVYREAYLDLARPSDLEGGTGPWPDALIPAVDPFYGEPRDAFPVDVPAGENRVAWVDLLVPQGQAAGGYDGRLEVTADGGWSVTVPVHLEVRDFGIPSTATLRSAFGMGRQVCTAHYGNACTHDDERAGP